jgi:alpha-galactosidase
MAELKIAIIGAGSFVFGPSMLAQALVEHRLGDVELALVDVDGETLELMAGVGRRMAAVAGVDVQISTHLERDPALSGADFVVCAAAQEMHRRFNMDVEIVNQFMPGHLISEFGGIAGISYSLRQIALIEAITADMRRLCPDAWLLNVANPLPRVCQAAHESGIKTVGFCSVAQSVYDIVWRILHGETVRYPFTAARERYRATTAGLNHFAWLLELRDCASGEDVLSELNAALVGGRSAGNPVGEREHARRGYLLVPQDDHTKDFLLPAAMTDDVREPSHGTPVKRQERLALLREVAAGSRSWDVLLEHQSWERPVDLIAALTRGTAASFHSLNLPNEGQVSSLPRGVFVETPGTASGDGIQAESVTLPDAVLSLCQRTALVTETIVRGAQRRSKTLIHDAVELDPTVLDKAAGMRAIDACMTAHADLLPQYQ